MASDRPLPEDKEPGAMSQVWNALAPLDAAAQARVIRWAADKFNVAVSSPRPATTPRSGTREPESADADGDPEDLASFYHSASPRTDAEKVLAVAYYLQKLQGHSDVDSFTVNSELKQLGFGIGNVTRAFDSLMAQKPQLVMQTRKAGTSKQARKKFRVTDQGLRTIDRMLQGQPSEMETEPA
jgi:hypothetical protein